jgi:hypothetical protein
MHVSLIMHSSFRRASTIAGDDCKSIEELEDEMQFSDRLFGRHAQLSVFLPKARLGIAAMMW